MKHLKTISLLFSSILLFTNCDIQKKALKSKAKIERQNDITKEHKKVTEIKTEGAEISSTILPEKQREKDENGLYKELLQKIDEGNLTKTIYYRPDGRVEVNCKEREMYMKIIESYNEKDNSKSTIETKDKDQEKTEEFDSTVILYIVMGLFGLGAFALFLGYRTINKQSKVLDVIVKRLDT